MRWFLAVLLLGVCAVQQGAAQGFNIPPSFDVSTYNFQLQEESPIGTDVGTVMATDSPTDVLTYFLLPASEPAASLFTITNITGVIQVATVIDRESILNELLTFQAYVRDQDNAIGNVQIRVIITDINDNSPTFTNLDFTVSLAENSVIGHQVYIVSAIDPDQGNNADLLYNLTESSHSGSPFFLIDPSLGQITLIRQLDFDMPGGRQYILAITAMDRPLMAPRITSGTLTVNVQDVNDQPPIFMQSIYQDDIYENATMGEVLLSVSARDQDEGINDTVVYAIISGNLEIGGVPSFSITPSTGVIRVNVTQLDREQHSSYTLTVQAAETSSLSDRAFTTVEVTVFDVNDHFPIFDVPRYTFSVEENELAGATVGSVSAMDNDEGLFAQFEFSLVNVNPMPLGASLPFVIVPVTAIGEVVSGEANIILNRVLDYENMADRSFTFLVVATEVAGDGTRNGTAEVVVTLSNLNDNNPVFQQSLYTVTIPEDEGVGMSVITVVATDDDAGTFGQLVYSIISGNNDKVFNITTLADSTGLITTAASLDYELANSSTLVVQVADLAATNPRVNTTTVEVTVENINDNRPVFLGSNGFRIDEVTVSVEEEQESPVTVYQMNVVDLDGDLNELEFYISSGNNLGYFTIDQKRRQINTTMSLDFDLNTPNLDRFTLAVTVNDSEFIQVLTVNVYLVDINDNSPVFLNNTYSFSVDENTSQGTLIGTVSAVDDDSGTFGRVEYSLGGPSQNTDLFQVNPGNGQLQVRQNLNRETQPGPLEFFVVATDLDQDVEDRNMAVANVTVYVNDVNDNAPIFGRISYSFTVLENTDQLVGVGVTATDIDLGTNSDIIFSIIGGNEDYTFVIDPMTGNLSRNATNTIDYEQEQSYSLTILAEDEGTPTREAQVAVAIGVTDMNDNDPIFTQTEYITSIREDVAPGTSLIRLEADDLDSGLLGTLVYSIASVEGPTSFMVVNGSFVLPDSSEGVIYTTGIFDRESFQGPYTINVNVRDSGMPPNNGSTSVIVNVEDANDNAPVLQIIPVNTSPDEEQSAGILIAEVIATDRDAMNTNNSAISYAITAVVPILAPGVVQPPPDVLSHFALRMIGGGGGLDTTGQLGIVTNISLDYEEIIEYTIFVTASDNGNPRLSRVGSVTVMVLDINDNTPSFIFPVNASRYTATLTENSPFSRPLQFFATDEDSTSNAQVSFVFSAGQAIPTGFSIDGDVLTIAGGTLDYESQQSYVLNVTAMDAGTPQRSVMALVEITVLDQNDNSPIFESSSYTTDIDEGDYTDSPLVIQLVNSSDPDSGLFGQVTYEVFPASSLFNITTLPDGSGEVRIRGVIDRETSSGQTITLLVRDGGQPPLTGTATVTIIVDDVNDNTPMFAQSVYSASIPENQTPGLALPEIIVRATDRDVGINQELIFSLVNTSDFMIDPETREITTLRSFDYEQVQSFEVTILVRDNATDYRMSTSILRVDITDINDNTPYFVNFPVGQVVMVEENTTVGTLIQDIDAVDTDSSSNAQLVYQLANDEGKFVIDEDGAITLASSLDRETTGFYNLTVTVSDQGQPSRSATNYLYIRVEDINDVPPEIETDSYNFFVPEDVSVNTSLGKLLAFDSDEEQNGVIEFAIIAGDPRFRIITSEVDTSNSRQTFVGELYTDEPFDYEEETIYNLQVIARNVAPPYESDSANVVITVRDINDNAPVFSMPAGYTFNVPEITAINSPIGTAVATDIDGGGLNGTVRYQFSGPSQSNFIIDSESGVVTLLTSLDFESISRYELTVEAYDLSSAPLSSNTSIVVIVQDTNEMAPVFRQLSYSGLLMENVRAGAVLLQVIADEQESGASSVTYSLTGSPGPFTINSVSGVITTTAMLDREQQASYVLTVEATDNAPIPLSSFVQVFVEVTDANDNRPTFGLNTTTVRIPESSQRGTTLPETFTAIDLDIGANGNITYSIQPSDAFTVHPTTGVISVISPTSLDREMQSSLMLRLIASDGGANALASSLFITVELEDINDNPPVFTETVYTATVREGASEGVTVTTIEARDEDLNSDFIYSITAGDDFPGRKFRVDPTTGVIQTTSTTLDRETRDRYDLTVAVSDGGIPARTGTATVSVQVEDTNDNTPVCTQMFVATVREANEVEILIGRVLATDADSRMETSPAGTGLLTYSLLNNNLQNILRVDPTNGDVFGRAGMLDYETLPNIAFTVRVSDQPAASAGSSRSVDCQGTITLVDTNDNAPVFERNPYEVLISEGTAVGSTVIVVHANDDDQGSNGMVFYRFRGQSSMFIMDAVSGAVTLTTSLDSDVSNRHVLDVEAVDRGLPQSRNGQTALIIRVRDVDDTAPNFQQSFYDTSISEGASLDSNVIRVVAEDPDSQQLTYSITSGNNGNVFRINSTGNILVTRTLDRETNASYTLAVLAVDSAGNEGTTSVRITLTDENDEAPIFSQTAYTAFISENSPQGTPVLPVIGSSTIAIQAVDLDQPNTDNSRVSYQLEGPDASRFNIDRTSGVVSVARGANLNYESSRDRDGIILTVTALDSATNSLNNSVPLTIFVRDVNDMAPEFTRLSGYAISVREDLPPGNLITNEVMAIDVDTVGVGVRYSLTNAVPFSALEQFRINRETGDIFLVTPLDRETASTITLTVTASDMGEPPLSSVVRVLVTVLDVNDNSPQFGQDIFITTVPEFLGVGASAFQVTAVDSDTPGQNSEVTYTLNSTTSFFIINAGTGDITTTQALDYESQRSHQLSVVACDRGTPQRCSSTIVLFNVMDFNDEVPVFDQTEYTTDVCQTQATTGLPLIQPVATDADSGSNAQLTYSIRQAPTLFTIVAELGRISLTSGASAADIGSYDFTILATDNGATSLTGTAAINIRIIDCSTTPAPIYFIFPFQYFTINEGTNVFTGNTNDLSIPISATPADVNFAPDTATNPFGNLLNNLRIKSTLDLVPELRQGTGLNREARSLYTVILQARGSNGNLTYTSVTLQVLDINDSPPIFDSDLYVFSVLENTTAPTTVGNVMATDADEGTNSELQYSIQSVVPSSLSSAFIINPMSGAITTAIPLDRETTDTISFQVEATDGIASDTTRVRVLVEDANDCDPMFSQSSYSFSFLENLPTGTSVGSVRATDCDIGSNAQIQYFISGGSVGVFQLDSTSGVITTLNPVDFEQNSQYTLFVTATDMGSPPRSSDVEVMFQVLDFNDCPPVFTNHPSSVSIIENNAINSVIQTFSVQDCDSGINGVNGTRFSIIRGNEQGVLFQINEVTGTLTIVDTLDREIQDTYIVGVRAMDSATTNPLFSVTELTVNVIDENDNSPMFQVSGVVVLTVSEGEDIGQALFTAEAIDVDEGSNSQVNYFLQEGDGDFTIAADSGQLSVARSLDRETTDVYMLTVVATDLSSEPRSSNITIAIVIRDENDNDPAILNIDSRVTTARIPEGIHNGTEVFIINATDPDIGANGFLVFSLDDDSNNLPFTVTGNVINANGELDFEEQSMYFLTIVAEDSGSPSRRTLATLIVEVTDNNDNPPIFNDAAYIEEQLENTAVGTSILRIQATDRDQFNTSNSIIQYTLDDRNSDSQYFIIDSVTGVISNNISLDRESRMSYTFSAIATNNLSTTLRSGTTMVTIAVGDVNDEVPMFGQTSYGETLSENTPTGTTVLIVSAADLDQPNTPNSDLIYTLTQQANNPFFISPDGVLVVQNSLNYEATTSFTFEVVVSDKGSPAQSSTARISVNLTDVNDERPVFGQTQYTVSVGEGVMPTSLNPLLLTTLQYSDADTLTENTRSSFTILNVGSANSQATIPSDLFTAATIPNMATGELYLTRPVNYEDIQSYDITVRVQNNADGAPGACPSQTSGACRLFSTADVTVNVVDVNDNKPIFSKSEYTGQISTTALPGASILSVKATDADLSPEFRTIQYELESNPQGRFRMDVNTGTLFTVGSFSDQDGSTFTLVVVAKDSSAGVINEARATVTLDVLSDFKRIAITFNADVNTIEAKQSQIVTLLFNLTNYEIVIEPYRDFSTNARTTTFIFHAVEEGQIVDFSQFIKRLGSNRQILFTRLKPCNITELTSIAVLEEFVYPPLLDTETIVILVMCLILIVGSIFLQAVAIRQRYVALHNARHKLLADVFYGSHAASSIGDNMQQENIELEMIETSGQTKKQNPMFVHPYDNWAGVDTSAAESVEGESNLQRDNPLYESQEIRMEMFADDSDDDGGDDDERDEAELLAAALQDEEDDDDAEDNSVTAI